MDYNQKFKYSIFDFLKLVKLLRSSNISRWDKTQGHSTVRSNLIEKAYEVLEAIDLEDSDMLKEELGDILFQIAFHCDVEEEGKNFSFDDVVDKACKKIISKYPHIFPENFYSEDKKCRVYNLKEKDKKEESQSFKKVNRRINTPEEEVKNVSRMLPALIRASKVQERAARSGYGLFSVEDAINETFERLHYLENLILNGRHESYEKEIGDLLFSMTEIARLINIDAESSLYDACERFKNEFLYKISLENRNKL